MEEPQDTVPAVADSCHCQGWAFLLSWSCPWSSCFYPCFNHFVFLRLVLLFFSLLVLVVVVFSTRVRKEKTWKTATCTTKNEQKTTQTKPPKQFCLNGISHSVEKPPSPFSIQNPLPECQLGLQQMFSRGKRQAGRRILVTMLPNWVLQRNTNSCNSFIHHSNPS